VKKKIIGIMVALALIGILAFQVAPALADAAGPLDHVVITPASATLLPADVQQFTAQGYDSADAAISGLNYFWLVTAGGGSINTTGLFTAGSTPGTFPNTVEVVAVKGNAVKTAYASITVNATAGPLDHVVITPASPAVLVGSTRQFTAQAYDATNIAITGLTYTWGIVAGGGTISPTGLFTTGDTAGVYANTVQVSTTQSTITKTALASVTVTTEPQTEPAVKPNIKKLTGLFTSYLNNVGFENFNGGQWTVKENGAVNTYKAIPGVVKAVSATALTILANGQTVSTAFALPAGTTILPKDATLSVDDRVVVVTVNDQVKLVLKITAPSTTTGNMPPGLKKNGKERDDNKGTPPGWEKGKKNGWNKDDNTDTEDD